LTFRSQLVVEIHIQPSPDVERWRRATLRRAGFEPRLAARVAGAGGFDLHELLALVDRGCPPELAVRIVAPLDAEGFR
jgi:hypothetical protein